jgi:hypothetical protein
LQYKDPTLDAYFPDAHEVHALYPSNAVYVPTGQAVHALNAALGGEYVPSIHEIQEVIPRPELYVPAAQEVQKEWPP